MEWEVEQEIKNLKIGKAPGADDIENKTLKDLEKAISKPLTMLFNSILEEGEGPEQRDISELLLIHKKGKRNEMENYRPISLTSRLV